jgi:hypothetical protein
MRKPLLTAAASILIIAANAPADRLDIARLAPEESFLILSIADWPALRTQVEEGTFGRLWKEQAVAKLVEKSFEDAGKGFTELLDSARIDREDLKHPTGHLGLALFWPEQKDANDDGGEPSFLIAAELGEHADEWEKIVDRFIDRGLDQRIITMNDDRYRNVRITIISPVYEEHAHNHLECDHDHHFGLTSILGGSHQHPRSLHIARIGDAMFAASHLQSLENAIDELEGDGRNTLIETPLYRDAMATHDRTALAHAAVFTAPLWKIIESEDAVGGPLQFLQMVGITGVRAIGLSFALDTADAVADMNMTILAPEKTGLLQLIDEPAGAFDPPAFVQPGTAAVNRFSFRFDRLLDEVRAVVRNLPAQTRDQILPWIDQGSAMAGPALEALGPTVHTATAYRQPFAADSSVMLWAIEVRDELAVANTLQFLAGQAGGFLESRDFEGTVMYSTQRPVELSLAIGFGNLFIGSTTAVEGALRAAGRPDAPRLAEERDFRDAIRNLGVGAVAYTFMDTAQWLRWYWWSIENTEQTMRERFDEWGLDPEYRDEMLRHYRENKPEWQENLPPVDMLTSHIGNLVYEIRSTREGFTARTLLLKPRQR